MVFAKIASISLAAICCTVIATASPAETRTFELSGFDGVSVADGIHLFVTTGEPTVVVAESDDARQLKRLELDVRRGTLRAQMDDRRFSLIRSKGWKVTVRVTMPSLVHAETSSGAELVADMMGGSSLELESSSGSTIRIGTIDDGGITADASSGADIRVSGGTCKSLSAEVSSGSSMEMEKLRCENVEINASSGANASVHADKLIDADASSGASIRVFGARENIEIETSGGGDIDFR